MKFKLIFLGLVLGIILNPTKPFAQDKTSNKFGKGLRVTAQDSSFSMRFGARFQTLYMGVMDIESKDYEDRFLIRRARLKFDGFAYSPKLTYKIELGLSNSDIAGASIAQAGKTASVIYDAVLKYNFYKNWSVWFGQAKLPGNIERVISSGALQFVDRSSLNSRFNIDRDAGIQLHYSTDVFRFISAVSSGEGRNITIDNDGGYDFTNRVEWLPFGAFAGDSEYSASDLKREADPKLMLGVTYDHNDHASRERGQLGNYLSEQRTLKTWFVDAHFKYNGFSAMAEYVDKQAVDGSVIVDDNGDYLESFYVGKGFNMQAGYLLGNNIEIAARYTNVVPQKETLKPQNQEYTLGISKYIVGHALKIQSDVTWIEEPISSDLFMYRFQVELSF